MTWEDAQDAADVLVATGRAVPAHLWVDSLIDEARRAEWTGYMPA